MLPKIYRVRKNREFREIYQDSRSLAAKNIVLFYRQRKDNQLKIGFSVSKKNGKAHERNLIKRRLRALAQDNLPHIKAGYDLIFLARMPIKKASFQEIGRDMNYLLKKSGVLNEGVAEKNPFGND